MRFGRKKLSLMASIIVFITSMMLIFAGSTLFFLYENVKKEIEVSNKRTMKVLVDSAYGYIESLQKGVENGEIESVEEAQEKARNVLAGEKIENNLRNTSLSEFKVGTDGYVWAWTDQYIAAMHPMGYEGQNGKFFQDVNGKYVIQDFSNVSKNTNSEDRFYEYKWRNKNEVEGREKIAYLRYFEPWDWNIGIGLYEDEIFAGLNKFIYILLSLTIFNLVIGTLLIYFIFRNYEK